MTSHQIDISEYENDPRLFLFTSLTAGSSHIITATSRMETILKANKIPFQAIDLATDEKARRLWQRRARERKLPGLVKDGFVLGDLDEVEEWNEFGELKENIGNVPSSSDATSHTVKSGVNIAPPLAVNPTATQGTTKISQPPMVNKTPPQQGIALPGAAEIAARNKPTPEQKEGKSVIDENTPPKAAETMNSAPKEKEESINAAKKLLGEGQTRGVEHLSAPPSALQSGTATPALEAGEEVDGTDKVAASIADATSTSAKIDAPTPDSSVDKTDAPAAESTLETTPDTAEEDGAAKLTSAGETADSEKLTHRGSEVRAVPDEEVKKIESQNSLAEAAEEEVEEKGSVAVEATDAGEGKVGEGVKEQSAKEDGDVGKSVGD